MPASSSASSTPWMTTIDSYIAAFPDPDLRARLETLRDAIRKTAPAAVESISYRIPAFKLNGKPLVYFAGWKTHIGLYPISATVQAAFEEELTGYKRSRGTIQFPNSKPLPLPLIRRMVKFRMQELALTKKSKK